MGLPSKLSFSLEEEEKEEEERRERWTALEILYIRENV